MGARGPAKTPTATLKQRGSWRGKTRKDEPATEPGIPKCPRWVPKKARKHWKPIAEQLDEIGLMSPTYSLGLAQLVSALAHLIECEALVEEHGYVAGERVSHAFRAWSVAWDRVDKAIKQFGMTPSAIAGLSASGKSKDASVEDPKLALLKPPKQKAAAG